MNDSAKLYSESIVEISEALDRERDFMDSLTEQVKNLREALSKESQQRDELKAHVLIQRKQIENYGRLHMKETERLERGLTSINEGMKSNMRQGVSTILKLEKTSKHLNSVSASQFYLSKHNQSKMINPSAKKSPGRNL